MNAGKSLAIFLAKKGMLRKDFAEKMNVSANSISRMIQLKKWSGGNIEKAAAIFEISASEFIREGEE